MSDVNFKNLISHALKHNTETDKVEFKDARGGIPSDIWRPITAFSNTPGYGLIVFGVAEDKKTRKYSIVGNNNINESQEKILERLKEIKNCGAHKLEVIELEGLPLIVLYISEVDKESKPSYKDSLGLPKGACIRVGNTNRQLTETELRDFLRYTPLYRYDRTPIRDVGLDGISNKKIDSFLEKSAQRTNRNIASTVAQQKVLKNLGILVNNDKGEIVPSLAGYLLFAEENPQNTANLERYITRCIKYAGKSASTPIISSEDIFGTLDAQVELAYNFVLKNINFGSYIVNAKRLDRYEYPEDAIREVLANAIVHRDYIITGTYTQVVIYSDRVEISNAGKLPPGITVQNLKDSQFSRNEVIANIMRELSFMEEFGRGIDLVYARMSEYGLVEPLFKNTSNMFKVTLLGESYKDLNPRQIYIWHYLQDKNKASISNIQEDLFPNLGRSTLNRDLKQLVEMELISQKGSSSSTYYEPKY